MEFIPSREEPARVEDARFIDSPFVEVVSGDVFAVEMRYPVLGMKNSESQCFVRREVYDRLVKAAQYLPNGFRLKVWDAWRPFALQEELFYRYSDDVIKEFGLEDCTDDQKQSVIKKFVSEPIEDRDVPPVHTTGGAVDVTIVDSDGRELEMGTKFDAFSDRTYTAYFENGENKLVRDNRRLLYSAMTKAGFTNLPSEWWHFDYGDRFWAYYSGEPAIYRGVFTKKVLTIDKCRERR
jgi:D-alanyl-D-alanine dipeptidase